MIRYHILFALTVVLVGVFHESNGQNPKDLFVSGDRGVHTFRIPAIAVSTKGTVIAICDARHDDGNDLPGNIDLVMRRSVDHGVSWEPLTLILDMPEGHGCGDPSLIVDRITGRIFCFYAYGPPGIGIRTSKPGTNDAHDPNTLHAQYIYSDNDGNSWSDPVELNPMIKSKTWEGLFAASGHGIQSRSGRLIQPYVIRYDMKGDGSLQTHARNAYSDDHGATWQMSAPAGIQVGETKVVELSDGRIMQNMRNRQIRYRSVSVSHDNAASFSEMWQDSTLIGPRCNASITRYASVWEGSLYNVLAFSNPASQEGRKNMTVRLSLDEGASWPIAIPVYDGPSAYSSLIRLYDGHLGLLYENGIQSAYEKISFLRVDQRLLDSLIQEEAEHSNLAERHKHGAYYYHSAHQFARLPDTEKEIVFLGNSISDGGEWHELLADSRMKNRGISGDITDGILYRLQDITKLKPEKIFLLVGVNDLARGRSVSYVHGNHERIYTRIRQETPDTKLMVQAVMPVNASFGQFKNHTDKTDSIIKLNHRLEESARQFGHTYIDLFTPLSDAENRLRKDLTEDGLHLNGRGYQVWKYMINEYLK